MSDINIIKNLWSKVPKSEPINLYINIPFCNCQCRYCLYKGDIKANSKCKEKYVNEYLIKNINEFKDVLSGHVIESVYFGGGTPNAVSIESIKKIIDSIDGFSSIHNKVIEINPAFCNEQYLKSICELGFTLITFGVQSFSKDALLFQQRPYCNKEKIKRFGRVCKQYNIKFSIDIMCYLKTYTLEDLGDFEDDVNDALSTSPDFVTIYPELNLILKDEKARNGYVNKIKELKKDGYKFDTDDMDVGNNPRGICRLIKEEYSKKDFYEDILSYYENDFPYAIQNIIGFGDYNCRQEIISYSPKRFFYTEKYNNGNVKYDIRYNIINRGAE